MNRNGMTYRPCVGIALFNQDGKILLGKRTVDQGSWAMPQSGITEDETVMIAARRELFEALGITDVRMLTVAPEWFNFDFPSYLLPRVHNGKFCGQKQKWVAAHYLGKDSDININMGGKNEFSAWKWEDFSRISTLVVPYKRAVYRSVYETFRQYAKPISAPVKELAAAAMEKTMRPLCITTAPEEKPVTNIVPIYIERTKRTG